MTAPKLKPCPFCGGEASHNGGGGSVFGRFWWTVGCKACDVWFADPEVWSNTGHGMLDPAYPPKHCFAAWNTRADLHDDTKAQLAECEARLEKAVEALRVIKHTALPIYGVHDMDAKTIRDVWAVARDVLAEIEKGGV